MNRRTISVLIVDNHEIVRGGIRRLLEREPGWLTCREAASGLEASRIAEDMLPDIVILNVSMPGISGLEALRLIKRASPRSEIIVFSVHNSEILVREFVIAGARGFVMKSDRAALLLEAVVSLSEHKPYFSQSISGSIIDTYVKLSRGENMRMKPNGECLTTRERQVIQLLSSGWTNKYIAKSLDISIKTVETHRSAIMRKISGKSIVDIVRYAIVNKYVQFE